MKTTVVNVRKDKYDVYIGRGSPFGNPFTVKDHGRGKCIRMFKKYFNERIEKDPEYRRKVWRLKSKRLGCYCKPEPCHGDIIKDYLDRLV